MITFCPMTSVAMTQPARVSKTVLTEMLYPFHCLGMLHLLNCQFYLFSKW